MTDDRAESTRQTNRSQTDNLLGNVWAIVVIGAWIIALIGYIGWAAGLLAFVDVVPTLLFMGLIILSVGVLYYVR
jgi:hypothetical protein